MIAMQMSVWSAVLLGVLVGCSEAYRFQQIETLDNAFDDYAYAHAWKDWV